MPYLQKSPADLPQKVLAAPAKVTLLTATTIAVADMIGIGVFTSLGFQVMGLQSGFPLLLLWVVGGVVAMCGALSYAELAAAFPRSGGEYNFLSRIYHPALGFLAGWVSATVGFAAPVALAAMALGSYAAGVVPGLPPLLVGLGVVWLVSIVHLRGIEQGSLFHMLATFIKVGLILAFIVFGFAFGEPQPISFAPASGDLSQIFGAAFGISLVFVMFSYSGWNAATYITSEVEDPARTVPRALFFGTLIVLILYVLLNAVFLYATPISKLAGQLDVGLVAGRAIFGDAGGKLAAALICIGLVSSISAMMWIGPRVTMVMGEDFHLLKQFSRKSASGVPQTALLFQLVIVHVLMLTQSFEAILDFIQVSLLFCSFLVVAGVIVLRFRRPDLPRPYRTWGYPLTPAIFLAVTAFMMYYLFTERPGHALAGFGWMLIGLALYAVSARQTVSRAAMER